jgi:hypothetical protein
MVQVTVTCGPPIFAEGVQWEPAIILFGLPPFL